jgi:hypothetical protein
MLITCGLPALMDELVSELRAAAMSLIFHETESGDLRLVGDFDFLYRTEADPWGQSGQGGDLASDYLLSRNRFSDVVERLHTAERLTG